MVAVAYWLLVDQSLRNPRFDLRYKSSDFVTILSPRRRDVYAAWEYHCLAPGVNDSLGNPPSVEVQDGLKMDRKSSTRPERPSSTTVTHHLKLPAGGRVKCRMKCTPRDSESRSTRIKIWMKPGDLISEIEPGIPR